MKVGSWFRIECIWNEYEKVEKDRQRRLFKKPIWKT